MHCALFLQMYRYQNFECVFKCCAKICIDHNNVCSAFLQWRFSYFFDCSHCNIIARNMLIRIMMFCINTKYSIHIVFLFLRNLKSATHKFTVLINLKNFRRFYKREWIKIEETSISTHGVVLNFNPSRCTLKVGSISFRPLLGCNSTMFYS